jgi:hypothetical protein
MADVDGPMDQTRGLWPFPFQAEESVMTKRRNTTSQKPSQPTVRSKGLSEKPASFARRYALLALGGAVIAGSVWFINSAPTTAKEVVVYKNPSCGCCSKWADHLRTNGFAVEVKAVNSMADVKERFGTPWQLESCHTALIDGYVIEGHVPVREINRLLAERPEVKGLAIPGMPAGSPGMEGRYTDPYDVMLFPSDGSTEVYARY